MVQFWVCVSVYFAAHIGFCESSKAWLTHLDKHGAEQLMAEHWLPLSQLQLVSAWWISVRVSPTPKSVGTAAQAETLESVGNCGSIDQGEVTKPTQDADYVTAYMMYHSSGVTQASPSSNRSELPSSSKGSPLWRCMQKARTCLH